MSSWIFRFDVKLTLFFQEVTFAAYICYWTRCLKWLNIHKNRLLFSHRWLSFLYLFIYLMAAVFCIGSLAIWSFREISSWMQVLYLSNNKILIILLWPIKTFIVGTRQLIVWSCIGQERWIFVSLISFCQKTCVREVLDGTFNSSWRTLCLWLIKNLKRILELLSLDVKKIIEIVCSHWWWRLHHRVNSMSLNTLRSVHFESIKLFWLDINGIAHLRGGKPLMQSSYWWVIRAFRWI